MIESNHNDEQTTTTLSFIAEWFDPHPQLTKRYLLKYYLATHEVEMKEVCSGRKFLKRTKIDESQSLSSNQPHQHNRRKPQRDFYVGATICLLSRDLKLVDYGDNATRIALDEGLEKTVAVLTPRRSRSGSCGALSSSLGKILQTVEECGLTLVDMKGFRGERGCYIDVDGRIAALGLDVDHLSPLDIGEDVDNLGGMCIAMELRGVNSLKIVSDLAVTIRREGEDTNTGDGSFVAASNMIDVELLRGVFLQTNTTTTTATYDTHNTTCCIIKPHAIKAQSAGDILSNILSHGYRINAIQLFHLDRQCAAEFYEVYDTSGIVAGNGGGDASNSLVRKDYNDMIDELTSGPVLALEVRCGVVEFRTDVAGPWDVKMAKSLYPDTIRAKFGVDRVRNAIHCTDLPGDNVEESSFFFSILSCMDGLEKR